VRKLLGREGGLGGERVGMDDSVRRRKQEKAGAAVGRGRTGSADPEKLADCKFKG
jgi:hypothetical protein